jgi:hypothetical protein
MFLPSGDGRIYIRAVAIRRYQPSSAKHSAIQSLRKHQDTLKPSNISYSDLQSYKDPPSHIIMSAYSTPSRMVSFGRGGYNKDDEEEIKDQGRGGYNKGEDEEEEANRGRGGYNKDDDEEEDRGRGGYN